MKSLDDRISWVLERGDSLAIDQARWYLEYKASEHHKGFVVKSRLKRVLNKAMKCNVFMCEEEVQRFPHWYIEIVKTLDRHVLQSNHEMHRAFQAHLHDFFVCFLDLLVQELHSYLANLTYLGQAEVASCKGLVIECKVHDV